jgi:predicted membrane-bound spermidine synthase
MAATLQAPEPLAESEERPAPRLQALRVAVAGLSFLLSGCAGLIYQVSWQRILALHSGVGIYSVAMIVAAFMAGLGVGSHLGGMLSLRLKARWAVRAFALVELGIGAFGAVSCWLFYDVLYLKAAWLYTDLWRAGLLHFLGLFVPCCLMGMSLPFLVRGMVSEASSAGRVVGVLYGINLLGASLGALVTPWYLIPNYGIRGAVLAAALANLAAGILGLGVGTLRPREEGGAPAPAASEPAQPFPLWVGLYALSGCVALSFEILWFRILDLAVKATAYTFGTLLALYLAGSALGCLAGAFSVGRIRRPLRAFLLCQCALLAYAGLAVLLLARLPIETPGYAQFHEFWRKGGFYLGQTQAPATLRALYLWLPLALFGLPTMLMGLSFPILQRAVQEDPRTSGRKVGILQTANIAGCVLGSLLVGLVALTWLGTTGTVRALLVAGLVFAGLGVRAYGVRSAFGVAAAALVALAVAQPGQGQLWRRLHGIGDAPALIEEDATGLSALISRGYGRWVVYVNGKGHSWIPFGGVHTVLGAFPAAMHPAPVDVAVIGLGSGDTAWATGSRPETQHMTVFEISGPQPRLLRRLAATEDLPVLRRFLDDPRLRIKVADGRTALGEGGARYDIIEADAQWPVVAYAGNLYSVEFFQHCARHLKPGGLVVTWAPTPRVYSSFVTALPNVLGNGDRTILVGSNEPLEPDMDTWEARLRSPAMTAYLGQDGVDRTLALLRTLRPYHRSGRQQPERHMNFDLFPRDEFFSP